MIFEQVKEFLDNDERFYYQGRGANLGVWRTSQKGEELYTGNVDLKKELARKGYGAFQVILFEETEQGLELKITMHVPSYCVEDTFFEGFCESLDDFKSVFRMLGL